MAKLSRSQLSSVKNKIREKEKSKNIKKSESVLKKSENIKALKTVKNKVKNLKSTGQLKLPKSKFISNVKKGDVVTYPSGKERKMGLVVEVEVGENVRVITPNGTKLFSQKILRQLN